MTLVHAVYVGGMRTMNKESLNDRERHLLARSLFSFNVFEEYKDVMIQNGLYDSELQKGIEEVTNLLEDN